MPNMLIFLGIFLNVIHASQIQCKTNATLKIHLLMLHFSGITKIGNWQRNISFSLNLTSLSLFNNKDMHTKEI